MLSAEPQASRWSFGENTTYQNRDTEISTPKMSLSVAILNGAFLDGPPYPMPVSLRNAGS